MTSISVKKTLSGLALGAGLFMLLGAARCDGPSLVKRGPLPNGQCTVTQPSGATAPIQVGDVIQLANANNVNDFIQCRVLELGGDNGTGDYLVVISPVDAIGHAFVGDENGIGSLPAWLWNLSRG